MNGLLHSLLAALLLPACPPGWLRPPDVETGTLPADDTAGDDTGSMGDCESGICPLEVSDAWAECGKHTKADPPLLTAASAGPGSLYVVLENAAAGCCPTVLVTAEAHLRADPYVEAFVDLSQDDCECVCRLDVGFRLSGIPAGHWTVRVMGSETDAEVE